MTNDSIADMLIRIKNAYSVGKTEVVIPASNVKANIANVLKDGGYIADVKREEGKPSDSLVITLRYHGKEPAITEMKRVSKPGLRRYSKVAQFPRPLSGHGLVIVSTPKGIMSGGQAQKEGIGGEIIATVW